MNNTAAPTISGRTARYIEEALLQPAQVTDVVLDKTDPSRTAVDQDVDHAHGDFFHADA